MEYVALRSVWDKEVPSVYVECVGRIRDVLVFHGKNERLASRRGNGSFDALGNMGLLMNQTFVKNPEDREDHRVKAFEAGFPEKNARGVYKLESDYVEVLKLVLKGTVNGVSLSSFRQSSMRLLSEVSAKLEALTKMICEAAVDRIKTVAEFTGNLHFALVACLCDAMGWPDKMLTRRLLYGFKVTGQIEDSGLFTPVANEETEIEFEERASKILRAEENLRWTAELENRIGFEAKILMSRPGGKERMEGLVKITEEEKRSGNVKGPFTRNQMESKFGRGKMRPMKRFGNVEESKVRAVDDGAGSRTNEATRTVETIALPGIGLYAQVVGEMVRLSALEGVPVPRLVHSLDDWVTAYRLAPSCEPWYTTVVLWHPEQSRVVYYIVVGNNYGTVSAVLNFCRMSTFVSGVGRRMFAVMVDNYIDDHIEIDREDAGDSAQRSMWTITKSTRHFRFSDKKRKPPQPLNVALGVDVDLSRAHDEGKVTYSLKEGRAMCFMAMMERCRREGWMSVNAAQELMGVFNFMGTAIYGKVGQASLQVFSQAVRDKGSKWSEALEETMIFLKALLAKAPVRTIDMSSLEATEGETFVVLYVDACMSEHDKGVGAILFDHEGRRLASAAQAPEWLLELLRRWSAIGGVNINQLELVGIILGILTFKELVRGRRLLLFCDNTTALSAAIHGYASKPDLARLSNILHIVMMRLELDVWFEYVPSAVNWADEPSRLAIKGEEECRRSLEEMGFEVRTMEVLSAELMLNLEALLSASL